MRIETETIAIASERAKERGSENQRIRAQVQKRQTNGQREREGVIERDNQRMSIRERESVRMWAGERESENEY